MPGQPKLNALANAIEDDGGNAVILDRIAGGDYLTEVAADWAVSVQLLRKWIRADPERVAEYEVAKRLSADALVEAAGVILDDANTISSQHIAKAKSRSEFKRWLAAKRDREQYGDDVASLNLNLDLGGIHLDALRSHGRAILIPEADVELLPDEPETSDSDAGGPSVRGLAPVGDGDEAGAEPARD